ncbi:14925_t:CDS:2 [Funneliformis mosseae]|uniref:14925_t:CDS:1 n=1 Tax=Funneliformis mosseae TaxID=27381 RepID=A0A9N8YUC6_FUNMO|nr:14925_t:CDS:2 [Funneliformis mosseae]
MQIELPLSPRCTKASILNGSGPVNESEGLASLEVEILLPTLANEATTLLVKPQDLPISTACFSQKVERLTHNRHKAKREISNATATLYSSYRSNGLILRNLLHTGFAENWLLKGPPIKALVPP